MRAITLASLAIAALLASAGLAAGADTTTAQDTAHQHAHAGAGAAVAQITLDAGKKWPTDESLRKGMAAIGRAFDADHGRIHAGTETDEQYQALAARIEAEVNDIVAHCKLPPAADANLHYVIADLLQGVGLMRGQSADRTRHDGAALVHGALDAYARFFDDPQAAGRDHSPR